MEAASVPLPTDTALIGGLRLPYSRPRLTVHGDVQTITQMAGSLSDLGGASGLTAP